MRVTGVVCPDCSGMLLFPGKNIEPYCGNCSANELWPDSLHAKTWEPSELEEGAE